MANWVVALDEDGGRRGEYARLLEGKIAPVAGLRVESRAGSGWSAVWAAAPAAPVDARGEAPWGALLWGEARDEQGTLQDAAGVRDAWREGALAQWDGYYAAAVIEHGGRSLTVGTDLLGMFPVYYWTDGAGVVLVGTSAELFRSHPRFTARLDETGLVGILLTNGLVDGRTLWNGVRRLGPGRRLRVDGTRVWEAEGYRIPLERCAVELPLAGHVEQLHEAVGGAVKRHAPAGRRYGILLSGGLDSRLLAGYLAGQGAEVSALTFGASRDVEMRCARRIASHLCFPHRTAEVAPVDYGPAAERLATWEGLAAGFCGVPEWAQHAPLAAVGDRVLTGHVMDALVGGSHIGWARDPRTGKMGFDAFLVQVAAWAFTAQALRSLLAPASRDAVDAVLATLRTGYAAAAEQEHHRAWIFDLHHRQRFHVGSALWVAAFAAWPVMPIFDRHVVAAAAALPASSLADRRAQTDLLVTRFPQLAALPLDRNSGDQRPLVSGLADELRYRAGERLSRVGSVWRRLLRRRSPQMLYYPRIYNLDGPGWGTVRALAEPHRRRLPATLLPEGVDQHLPPPGRRLALANPVKDGSGARLLLGLALWSRAA